jgi:hypothetical protein
VSAACFRKLGLIMKWARVGIAATERLSPSASRIVCSNRRRQTAAAFGGPRPLHETHPRSSAHAITPVSSHLLFLLVAENCCVLRSADLAHCLQEVAAEACDRFGGFVDVVAVGLHRRDIQLRIANVLIGRKCS